jgi:hypothetical protein
MTFLTLELAACASVVLTIKKVAPKLAGVPFLIKVVHFIFVASFCVIGVDGFHILVWIFSRHQEYSEAFSNTNPLGIDHFLLECVGYGFALAGAVLCLASLKLGDLRSWALRTVLTLALPYCVLYPSIMATVSKRNEMHSDIYFARVTTLFMLVWSVAAIIFYTRKSVRTQLVFK